jgi:predicted DCC family thiol-disulfide oxidoreductase YuxK
VGRDDAAADLSVVGRELILFDGACGLCQRSIRFIARADRTRRFWFAPLQGHTAARALARHPLARETVEDGTRPDTIVFVSADDVYTKSDAALRILVRLGWPWRLFGVLLIVPRSLRDLAYDVVARHRRQWFGGAESCGLPPAALTSRLLE